MIIVYFFTGKDKKTRKVTKTGEPAPKSFGGDYVCVQGESSNPFYSAICKWNELKELDPKAESL